MNQPCDRSSIYPQGDSLDFFSKGQNVKRGQYFSMNAYNVDREYRNKNGKLIKTNLKRRPVNRVLNGNKNFNNQEDVLDLLIKDTNTEDIRHVMEKEMSILNKFYKMSQELSTPNGIIKSNAYCRLPKIQFKQEQALPKIFINDALQYRFKQQQLVASSFVSRGYGFDSFLAEVADHPKEVIVKIEQYRNLLGTVITQAFRKAQTFAIEQCCMDIRKANRSEIKLLLSTFLNCRACLQAQDCQTFFDYIKMCFYLGDVFITAQASVRFMGSIQQELKKKIFEKTGEKVSEQAHRTGSELMWTSKGGFTNEKLQLHRIWNGQLERMFISVYKKEQDMSKITRHFKRVYAKKQNFFTVQSLKTRLYRTLREAIKKVQFLRDLSARTSNMPQLHKISKHCFKGILSGRGCYSLRVQLLQVYQNDNCTDQMISNVVSMLNYASNSSWGRRRQVAHGGTNESLLPGGREEEDIDIDLDIEQLIASEE